MTDHLYPHNGDVHDFLARERPEFERLHRDLSGAALAPDERAGRPGLSARHRELVVLGILAFRGASEEAMVSHVRRAFELGASREELLDTFEAAVVPGGTPAMIAGMRALMLAQAEVDDSRSGRRP